MVFYEHAMHILSAQQILSNQLLIAKDNVTSDLVLYQTVPRLNHSMDYINKTNYTAQITLILSNWNYKVKCVKGRVL